MLCTVTDRNILLSHAIPVQFWEPSSKSNSLPVDRKYQKGQSRDNYINLLFNSKCKCDFSAG